MSRTASNSSRETTSSSFRIRSAWRRISLNFVPTAILSRQVAVIRKQALIVNLPGQPKSIRETLEGVRAADGSVSHVGIFAAIPYCIDLIGGPYAETNPRVIQAFRPKSAT